MNFMDFCKGFYRGIYHFLTYAGHENKLDEMGVEDKETVRADIEMVESDIVMFAAGAVATLIIFIVVFGSGCIVVKLCDVFDSIIPFMLYPIGLILLLEKIKSANNTAVRYNKLVRDKIPEIIEADGQACKVEVLSERDYLKMVDAKLDEELAEYHKDQNIEELADLVEVIYAAVEARGWTLEDLEKVRREKAEKRGAFQKRLLLKNTGYIPPIRLW